MSCIFEPKHSYFLLQRTGVETNTTAPAKLRFSASTPGEVLPLELLVKREDGRRYDVFISYNSQDRAEVDQIVTSFRGYGIVPWIDSEIRPGDSPQRALQEQIERCDCAAVFLGKNGEGRWQKRETEAFLDLNRRVIPVILPSALPELELPLFLRIKEAVDFRLSSPPPLQQLIWGITGTRSQQ